MSENLRLDPMTEELHDIYQPEPDHLLNSLDGAVNQQGIKIGHRDWLDMGSDNWKSTPDKVKAAAYQAAKLNGWSDASMRGIIKKNYPHLTDHILNFTFTELHKLAKSHPIDAEEVPEERKVQVQIVRRGSAAKSDKPVI